VTNGRDLTLQILDARTSAVVRMSGNPRFRTLTNHALALFGPDRAYVTAGSGNDGDLFV